MFYIYIYWSNKTKHHEEKLAEITASSMVEADKVFQAQTGIDPVKTAYVSCQILGIDFDGYVQGDIEL